MSEPTDMLYWVTNHPKSLKGMWPRRENVHYVEGPPQATPTHTKDELIRMGCVGVYTTLPPEEYQKRRLVNADGTPFGEKPAGCGSDGVATGETGTATPGEVSGELSAANDLVLFPVWPSAVGTPVQLGSTAGWPDRAEALIWVTTPDRHGVEKVLRHYRGNAMLWLSHPGDHDVYLSTLRELVWNLAIRVPEAKLLTDRTLWERLQSVSGAEVDITYPDAFLTALKAADTLLDMVPPDTAIDPMSVWLIKGLREGTSDLVYYRACREEALGIVSEPGASSASGEVRSLLFGCLVRGLSKRVTAATCEQGGLIAGRLVKAQKGPGPDYRDKIRFSTSDTLLAAMRVQQMAGDGSQPESEVES